MARKDAEENLYKRMTLIDPSGKNTASLKEQFANMTDAQFKVFVDAVAAREAFIPIIVDNMTGTQVSLENNFAIAKKLGIKFRQKVEIYDADVGVWYWSKYEHFVLDLPVRRMKQMLDDKISLPEDQNHIDDYTDQPTGASKGSSISAPESLIMIGKGAEHAATEFVAVRGGDMAALRTMEQSIHETGGASLEHAVQQGTGAKATRTLSTFLYGMHFDQNLVE